MAQHKTTRTTTTARSGTRSKSSKKRAESRKTNSRTRSAASSSNAPSAGDQEVTIDRRRSAGRRASDRPNGKSSAPAPKLERRQKVNRRRQIDPTTCERDYTDDEVEFMNALDAYKRKSGRMFPTCSEVLEVVRSLGYVKLSPADYAACQATGETSASSAPEKWFADDNPASKQDGDDIRAASPLAD